MRIAAQGLTAVAGQFARLAVLGGDMVILEPQIGLTQLARAGADDCHYRRRVVHDNDIKVDDRDIALTQGELNEQNVFSVFFGVFARGKFPAARNVSINFWKLGLTVFCPP